MFKAILIVLLFILCSLVGYFYGERFRKRHDNLKEVYKNLIILQNEVVYNNTPLPEALGAIAMKAKEPIKDFMMEIAFTLAEGNEGNVHSAFDKSYDKHSEEFYLQNEDKSILDDFFKALGESGVYGQEKIFKLALENLKININEASELSKKNTKLYRYLGVCFGAMISIFLL